jgi:hypothetical protein
MRSLSPFGAKRLVLPAARLSRAVSDRAYNPQHTRVGRNR